MVKEKNLKEIKEKIIENLEDVKILDESGNITSQQWEELRKINEGKE